MPDRCGFESNIKWGIEWVGNLLGGGGGEGEGETLRARKSQ